MNSTVRTSSASRPRVPVTRWPALVRAVAALSLLALAVAACSRGPGGSDTDGTVDNTNTCTTSVALPQRDAALEQATALNAVTWTSAPEIAAGTLVAAATLAQGVTLFDPLRDDDRDGPAFSVYYVGHAEALVELVPDFPDASKCWETTATLAPTEVGTPEGAGDRGFAIEASSPLFMNVAGADLELRVWGTDADGNDALLSKVSITTE